MKTKAIERFLKLNSLHDLNQELSNAIYCMTKVNQDDIDPDINFNEVVDTLQRIRMFINKIDS